MGAVLKADRPAARPVERWVSKGEFIFDPAGMLAATARSSEEARRFVAAVNAVEGMPTEALEAWTVGVICDPMNDLAGELQTVLEIPPDPNDRRRGERRKGERRRAATEFRID